MNWFEKSKPICAMLAVNFAFAVVNVLFKRAISGGLNNLVIITYRQSISVVSLAPLAYCMERKSWPSLTSPLLWGLFFSALVGPTLTSYLFLIGLKYSSTTYSCAFVNILPVATFILAFCFGVEKLNVKSKSGKAKVLGTLICVGGVLMLTLYKGMPIINQHASENIVVQKTSHDAKSWAVGSIFLGLAILTWSSWFLIQARIGKSYPFPYSSTAIMSFFSAIQSVVLCLAIDRNMSVWILRGPLEISTIIYAGIVGSGLCYVVMSWCIKIRGPVFTSAFSPFIQMFAAIFDVSMLHEQIYLGSILGSFVVTLGMYTLLWGKVSEDEPCKQTVQQEDQKDGDGNYSEPQVIISVTDHPPKT